VGFRDLQNKSQRRRVNRGPLRLVVGEETVFLGASGTIPCTQERLECGHLVFPAEDMAGRKYATVGKTRRRCPCCPALVPPEPKA
jgi:hypothetical protein